jgi:molybdopterin molybdotransferase
MIPLEEAFEIIEKEVSKLPQKRIPLLEAVGCILEEDVASPIDVPQFANSAMDGYALRLADLKGDGPWKLPIQKVIAAGESSWGKLKSGYVSKIMTGAPIPEGADSVIPVEDASVDSDYVFIKQKPPEGEFVRPRGDDIKKGEQLCKKGTLLDPVAVGILASVGMSEVGATPRPWIAVLSTGSELVNPGDELTAGQIYNSNDFVLKSLLKKDGHEISYSFNTSIDDVDELCKSIKESLADYDLVISSGGVSMGDFDLIPQAVKEIGGEILFHKVFVKPGKPVLLARVGKGWLLGLPGNPVSAVVGYHLYAKRIIAKLSGLEYNVRGGKGVLGEDLSIRGSRFCYIGAKLEEGKGSIIVYPSVRQKSGRLSSISGINGFILAEGSTRNVAKGTEVDIEWMN